MERLTERKAGITGLSACFEECDHTNNGCDCVRIRSALRRLSAYEDTRLTPEEITKLQSDHTDLKKFCDEWCFGEDQFQGTVNRLVCANIEIDSLKKDRDALKKALELACDLLTKYTCFKSKGALFDYFIQRAQEEKDNG